MALEKLPATFNLQELHKGFFVYSWIREDKYEYVGPYPPAEDYHPERMSEKRRKELYAWQKEKVESNAVFDFQKELSVYLHSDVEVLAQFLEAFAEEMVELIGINRVIECVTIASTANKVWRKNFLIRDLIALKPKNGWRQNQQNQSVEALQWLKYENSKMNGEIQVRGLTCVKSMQIKNFTCSVLPHVLFCERIKTLHTLRHTTIQILQ